MLCDYTDFVVGLASLQDAADACGIDKAALWRYFNGDNRPLIDRLSNLCKGLQVSLEELLEALSVDFNHEKLD